MQGRAIETNLYAQLKCDSVKIGMVFLLLYPCICLWISTRGQISRVGILSFSFCCEFLAGEASRGCSILGREALWLCIQVQWGVELLRGSPFFLVSISHKLHLLEFSFIITTKRQVLRDSRGSAVNWWGRLTSNTTSILYLVGVHKFYKHTFIHCIWAYRLTM